jgi:O-methyltransferase involved in polyketide biosynthesis
MIDHLLRRSIEMDGLRQVLEIGCGFSPRGFRFMHEFGGLGLKYVEADLPAMAGAKTAILERAGLFSPGHQVAVCNILEENCEESLENTILKYFDPALPLAVITEGVTCYFETPVIKTFWRRLAKVLRAFPGSVYLTDNNQNIPGFGRKIYLSLWKNMVGLVVRGRMYFHFDSDEESFQTFGDMGFTRVALHRADDFDCLLPLPKSRGATHMNIVEARP